MTEPETLETLKAIDDGLKAVHRLLSVVRASLADVRILLTGLDSRVTSIENGRK